MSREFWIVPFPAEELESNFSCSAYHGPHAEKLAKELAVLRGVPAIHVREVEKVEPFVSPLEKAAQTGEKITCHICTNGRIRPYSEFLCSSHRQPSMMENLEMTLAEIEEYNKELNS